MEDGEGRWDSCCCNELQLVCAAKRDMLAFGPPLEPAQTSEGVKEGEGEPHIHLLANVMYQYQQMEK